MKETRKSFLISLLAGAVVTAAVCFFNASSGLGAAHLLCDGFFVAAVVVAGSGGLLFVRNQGLFDIMSFGIKSVFQIHWPWTAPRTADEGKESFFEYKDRKRGQRKSPAGTLLAGAVYVVLAFVMLAAYTWL